MLRTCSWGGQLGRGRRGVRAHRRDQRVIVARAGSLVWQHPGVCLRDEAVGGVSVLRVTGSGRCRWLAALWCALAGHLVQIRDTRIHADAGQWIALLLRDVEVRPANHEVPYRVEYGVCNQRAISNLQSASIVKQEPKQNAYYIKNYRSIEFSDIGGPDAALPGACSGQMYCVCTPGSHHRSTARIRRNYMQVHAQLGQLLWRVGQAPPQYPPLSSQPTLLFWMASGLNPLLCSRLDFSIAVATEMYSSLQIAFRQR